MKTCHWLAASLSFLLTALVALAQPGGGDMPGMDLSFLKLYGDIRAFSARSEMSITDKSGKEDTSMTASVALLDGKLRTEVDMSKMKNAMLTPETLAQMKQMGMDRTISIARPDKKVAYIIYPGVKSYASSSIPEASVKSLTEKTKIEKTVIGKEIVDGHPCVKNKVSVPDDQGKTRDYILWNATDLKDFPIRFQTTEGGLTVTSTYKDISLAKPDAKQFEPPADFKAYDDMAEMQMAIMQKLMQENFRKTPQKTDRP